ncbi:hypothetical protein MMC13_007295 [Lambiella insularis]|nr:hypothetical protein [Lambiella insularis]
MGLGGRPSTGCAFCLDRHLKCDEALQHCGHCLKSGLDCPGYRAWTEVAWIDQNLVAEGKVKRRVNARKMADRAQVAKRDQVAGQRLGTARSTTPLAPVLAQDLDGYAINFFLSSYILLPEDQGNQLFHLECVYPVWLESRPSSPLRPALAAVASWMLEAWSELRPDVSLAWSRSRYIEGLAALRETLRNNEEATDDVLLATMLLDFYESLNAFIKSKPRESPHVSGMLSLINHHRQTPFASKASQKILRSARIQIIQKSYDTSSIVPSEVALWPKASEEVAISPKTRLDDIYIQAANLRACASHLRSSTKSQASAILKNAAELDAQCQEWEHTLPRGWSFTRVSYPNGIPQAVRDAGLYQDHCFIYENIFIANAFNRNFCVRIECQSIMLQCLHHLPNDIPLRLQNAAQATIQEMADNICASVPFHLGDRQTTDRIDAEHQYPHPPRSSSAAHQSKTAAAFGGWYLAPCLGALLSLDGLLRPGQRQWIGEQLARLMKVYIVQPDRPAPPALLDTK